MIHGCGGTLSPLFQLPRIRLVPDLYTNADRHYYFDKDIITRPYGVVMLSGDTLVSDLLQGWRLPITRGM
jgi:hypothetical protein